MTVPASRRPPPAFPVTVLTGFLGAGKTTLLNDLVRDGALSDTVVMINEFGDVGLDHLLVEPIDGDMLLMASGCLCCTIRGDLVAALEGLLRRRDNGRIAPFARVLIETTGLADPVPVLQTIIGHPYFAMRFRLADVVTVVDAVNGLDTLRRHPEAVRQVALADRIVVTKTDLADDEALRELAGRLSALNPHASQLDRARGDATAAALLGDVAQSAAGADTLRALASGDGTHAHDDHAHDDHGHGTHTHDRNRHSETIRSFALTRDVPVSATSLNLFLELLRGAHGPKLLRLKGLVALADDPTRPLLVHAVQHLLHPPVRLDQWPDDDHRTRMVVIVDDLEPRFVETLFAAMCGDIAPDRADRAALLDNPLAPASGVGLLA